MDDSNFEPYFNDYPLTGRRNSPMLFCSHYPDGKYMHASDSITRMLGYDPKELVDQDPFDYIHPSDRKFVRENSQELAIKYDFNKSVVYRIKHKEGNYILLETITMAVKNPEGEVLYIGTISWFPKQKV